MSSKNVKSVPGVKHWKFFKDNFEKWRWIKIDVKGNVSGPSFKGYETYDDCVMSVLDHEMVIYAYS